MRISKDISGQLAMNGYPKYCWEDLEEVRLDVRQQSQSSENGLGRLQPDGGVGHGRLTLHLSPLKRRGLAQEYKLILCIKKQSILTIAFYLNF